MSEITKEMLDKLPKELRITWILNGVLLFFMICVIGIGIYTVSKIQGFTEEIKPAVETIAELDVEAMNKAMAGLDTEELSEALKTLNDTVERMEEFTGSVKEFFSKLGGGLSISGF